MKVAEVKEEVKTFTVRYKCDICNKGYLESTGVALLSYPPQYPHDCSNCGKGKVFKHKYPFMDYEVIEK